MVFSSETIIECVGSSRQKMLMQSDKLIDYIKLTNWFDVAVFRTAIGHSLWNVAAPLRFVAVEEERRSCCRVEAGLEILLTRQLKNDQARGHPGVDTGRRGHSGSKLAHRGTPGHHGKC